MKIDSMPNRISMNVTVPKQTQGKNFGEKLNEGLVTGASILGAVMPPSPLISAAISSVTGLANSSAAAASYAATGVVGFSGGNNVTQQNVTIGAGSPGGPNLTAGAGTNPGSYNTDIVSMSAQNAQMLQVQMAMQRENTMFSSISNVLKTKHDTAKNSISNIR